MIDQEFMPDTIAADLNDPRIQAALDELRSLILAQYPDTTFEVVRRSETDTIWLRAITNVENLDDVTDVVIPRLIEMQVEEGLPVYVVGGWPPDRLREYIRQEKARWSPLPHAYIAPEGTI